MKRLMLVIILLLAGLFSQSDQRFASEQIFDIAGQMKVWSKALMTGEIQGVELSESQLVDTQRNIDQAKAKITLLIGGEIQTIETIVEVTVKAGVSQEAIDFFQELADNPTTYFYKSQRDKGIASRVQYAVDLLK